MDEITEAGKKVLVKFMGGIKQPQEVLIGPGTTAKDLLTGLGLNANQWHVSKGTGDTTYGQGENLYPLVKDGDLLLVGTEVDAGL